MTPEQFEMLVEVDPERFRTRLNWPEECLWNQIGSANEKLNGNWAKLGQGASAADVLWWMLQEMRKRQIELMEAKNYGDEWYAIIAHINKGWGAASESEVINAYIEWKQSCKREEEK